MVDIVVPTIARSSLSELLGSLVCARGPRPAHVILVDDRPVRRAGQAIVPNAPLDLSPLDEDFRARTKVLAGRAAGPAAARNAGWRASRARWIAFLDDDVVVGLKWLDELARDLHDLPPRDCGLARKYHRAASDRPPRERLGAQRRGAGRRAVDHRRLRVPPG